MIFHDTVFLFLKFVILYFRDLKSSKSVNFERWKACLFFGNCYYCCFMKLLRFLSYFKYFHIYFLCYVFTRIFFHKHLMIGTSFELSFDAEICILKMNNLYKKNLLDIMWFIILIILLRGFSTK